MRPTFDGRPEPTGQFRDVSYARNEKDRGPQFEIAVRLTEPVDQTWLALLRQHPEARPAEWDEEASEVSTLTVWSATSDVTQTLNGIHQAISDTNEKHTNIGKQMPTLDAELELWWQRLDIT
jgi:hypothetical protein